MISSTDTSRRFSQSIASVIERSASSAFPADIEEGSGGLVATVYSVEAADAVELRRQLHRQAVQVRGGDLQRQRVAQPADVLAVDHTNPPSTLMAWPVMYAAASEARKRKLGATSSGRPCRFSGTTCLTVASCCC